MHRLNVISLIFVIFGCSSSSSQPSGSNADGGDAGGDAAAGTVVVTGRTLIYGSTKPLAGVTIAEGGATTTTGADGRWSLRVPANTPVGTTLTMSGYIDVHLPEEIFTGDFDRGDIPIPDLNTFQLGEFAQPNYDESKASVSIAVRTLPSCASDEGATLTVTAPDGTSTMYFSGGLPSQSATSVSSKETPAISVYNIPAGSDLTLSLTHPTCKQAPFPVTVGNGTYTGKVVTEAGKANSALVLYLQ